MIYTTVTKSDFIQAFNDMGRSENFTYEARSEMYDYFMEFSEEIQNDIELDVIAICCEYSEYKNIHEFNDNYGTEYDSMHDIYETTVIPVDDDSFVILDY